MSSSKNEKRTKTKIILLAVSAIGCLVASVIFFVGVRELRYLSAMWISIGVIDLIAMSKTVKHSGSAQDK